MPDMVASPPASLTSQPSTSAPSPANSRAISWPSPDATPVTTVLRPARLSVATAFDLLWILVPAHLVADAGTQPPLRPLRLVFDRPLQNRQPLLDQALLLRADWRVAHVLAQLADVDLGRAVEPPIPGAETGDDIAVDRSPVGVGAVWREPPRDSSGAV